MPTSHDIAGLCVQPACSIREAAERMDLRHLGIIMVVDSGGRLLGTVTDGDLRRALLARIPMTKPVSALLDRKKGTVFARPISASVNATPARRVELLKRHNVLHLPLTDAKGRVAGLATFDELLMGGELPVQAVVMAGGLGTRLMPLTKNTPKPMLPVGDKPLMEIILEQLRDCGIRRVHISTHHKRDKIIDHFGDGRKHGVELSYLYEKKPLGTAGALSMLADQTRTTLVMNGDILTHVSFKAMLDYHREMRADLTMAVCQYDLKIPYGVVETRDHYVTRINEKPTMEFFVGAGIYILEPSALARVPRAAKRFDMTDLVGRLLKDRRQIASFPIREYWLDIGRPADYERAQQEAAARKRGETPR